MSTEYSANAVYGIFISQEQVAAMTTEVPEVVELKEKFDPDTGKSLGKQKVVVQEAFRALVIATLVGKGYYGDDDGCGIPFYDGLEVIAKEINNYLGVFAHYCQQEDIVGYVIGIGIENKNSKDVHKDMKLVDRYAAEIRKEFNKYVNKTCDPSIRDKKISEKPKIHAVLDIY